MKRVTRVIRDAEVTEDEKTAWDTSVVVRLPSGSRHSGRVRDRFFIGGGIRSFSKRHLANPRARNVIAFHVTTRANRTRDLSDRRR